MKISNRTYDILKWVALAVLPACEALILTVGKIWMLPYYAEIGATVAAVGVFLAAIIGVTSSNYYAEEDMHDMFSDQIEEQEDSEEAEG